jgi:hypothetical protein
MVEFYSRNKVNRWICCFLIFFFSLNFQTLLFHSFVDELVVCYDEPGISSLGILLQSSLIAGKGSLMVAINSSYQLVLHLSLDVFFFFFEIGVALMLYDRFLFSLHFPSNSATPVASAIGFQLPPIAVWVKCPLTTLHHVRIVPVLR